MTDNIISCADMMMKAANLDSSDKDLESVWKKVVSRIHSNYYESENSEKRMPIGERLASNTRIIDLKNGVLLIETDHSGWIQYLRFYQKFILTGLRKELPELKINSFAFRTAGSKALLSESYTRQVKIETEKLNRKIEQQEEEINSKFESKKENSSKKSNLPPEILEKFESIKKSMLTNSEK